MSPHPAGPPDSLLEILHGLSHPSVVRRGLTKTPAGSWALRVWLRKDVEAPLPDLEESVRPFPVVYDREPDSPQMARPAYPDLGE